MKKYIFTIGIALCSLTSVHAQKMKYGVKAGALLSNFIGKDLENKSMVNAFGGVYANLELSEKFFLQPELLYSMQGGKASPEINNGGEGIVDMDERINLNYLNIPIMLQYAVTKNARLEIGPQVGILLKSEGELDLSIANGISTNDEHLTFDLEEYTSAIDLGLNIGGVYAMDNGLNLTLRYSLGLTYIGDKVVDKDYIYFLRTDLEDIKNSVLSLGLGYTF